MDKQLSCLTRTELDNLGFGSLGVEEVTHCYCTLPDGCRLALRVWAPSGSLDIDRKWSLVAGDQGKGKFPTVLEYLPYRSVRSEKLENTEKLILLGKQIGQLREITDDIHGLLAMGKT